MRTSAQDLEAARTVQLKKLLKEDFQNGFQWAMFKGGTCSKASWVFAGGGTHGNGSFTVINNFKFKYSPCLLITPRLWPVDSITSFSETTKNIVSIRSCALVSEHPKATQKVPIAQELHSSWPPRLGQRLWDDGVTAEFLEDSD